MKGKLFLIPSTIGDSPVDQVIPGRINKTINGIRQYIVENERTARRMLIKLGITIPIDELTFYTLNKHTSEADIAQYLLPAENEDIGLLSEAGIPAVADPGNIIVTNAHQKGIRVVPLVGPSSIILALMASGLNGQNFAFNGYLPIAKQERIARLKHLESRSEKENQSQIFIETPYRNNSLLKDILDTCNKKTRLCIASNITTQKEYIRTMSIIRWRDQIPDLHKKPTIFLLQKDR